MKRRCAKCEQELPVENFYVSKNGRRSSWCKPCHIARSTERTRARRQTAEGMELMK